MARRGTVRLGKAGPGKAWERNGGRGVFWSSPAPAFEGNERRPFLTQKERYDDEEGEARES